MGLILSILFEYWLYKANFKNVKKMI